MANQLQATVYQIGATQQTDALIMSFPTNKIVVSEATLPTISAVNSRIDLYDNANSKSAYVSYYVSETAEGLLADANDGSVSMFGATVEAINLSPFRSVVSYNFPINGVSLWPYVSGTINSFIEFSGAKYYAQETVAALEALANSGPTEWLYVSSPVNKVFRLDGTENGKNKYTDPDDATNRIEWGLGNSWVIYLNDSIIYYNDTGIGDYPVSQNWLLDSNDDPAPISITRYHGTLQEVLEQISKPKEWPKVYRALLTQSGTDAPVATVLENTLGGEVVWSYVNVGAYRATLASAFPQDKTIFFIGTREGNAANSTQGNNYAYRVTDNEIEVTTAKADDTYENGNLVYTSFEILVYP